MRAYFDGSVGQDEKGDAWITYARIAATDRAWAEFDEKWSKMLGSRYPIAPYIHMIELLDNEDPFEEHVGWCYERKRQLIQDAVVLLSQMNKAGFVMTWSAMPESERLRLKESGADVAEDPYLHCAADCMFLTVGFYMLNVPVTNQEPIYVFYDRGERFLGNFKSNWLTHRTRPGKFRNPDNWFDSFTDVQDVDLPYHFGLQAADMVAWAHSRALSEKDRPYQWLKEWLVKVVPSQTIDHSRKTLLVDREFRKGWEAVFRQIP